MPGTINFSYRPAVDAVVATVDWSLETEEDVRSWYEEYRAYFVGRFRRKVDLILELSDFHVSPTVATLFGQYRARILDQFTKRSYRVNQRSRERTFMYTSAALHGAPANHFTSIDAAIAALLADREASESGRA
ncbi:MAG TPA: hypothetical protein VEK07_14590 [Polyangiaceae bacterium]|nr:hypothetical protein [Polyangiaceae bacterium]